MASGSLLNYYRDEMNDTATENNDANFKKNNNKTTTSKPFKYKTKIKGSTLADNNRLDTEVVVPIKYLSNFLKFLDLPLINREIALDFRWPVFCIISEVSNTTAAVTRWATSSSCARSKVNNTKLYVPKVTWYINDNTKVFENIKRQFKDIGSWNKYRSEITTQPKKIRLYDRFNI